MSYYESALCPWQDCDLDLRQMRSGVSVEGIEEAYDKAEAYEYQSMPELLGARSTAVADWDVPDNRPTGVEGTEAGSEFEPD